MLGSNLWSNTAADPDPLTTRPNSPLAANPNPAPLFPGRFSGPPVPFCNAQTPGTIPLAVLACPLLLLPAAPQAEVSSSARACDRPDWSANKGREPGEAGDAVGVQWIRECAVEQARRSRCASAPGASAPTYVNACVGVCVCGCVWVGVWVCGCVSVWVCMPCTGCLLLK
jgi:hypothetical protein